MLLNQPNPYRKEHTPHRGSDMALKVTGYKTALIPRGFNDFQTPCSLFPFPLFFLYIIVIIYVQHGRDYCHVGPVGSNIRCHLSLLVDLLLKHVYI